jgi:hypothetical protein
MHERNFFAIAMDCTARKPYMQTVAIDRTKGMRKVFTCPHELAEQIDAWRSAQRPIPSESAAVAELLRRALKQWHDEQKRRRQQAEL